MLGVVAMAGVGLYFFSQHINTKAASPANAAQDFEQVKARFADEKPLIELDEHGRYLRSHTDRKPPPTRRHLNRSTSSRSIQTTGGSSASTFRSGWCG